MKLATYTKIGLASVLIFTITACSSWDSMNRREKSTVTGAGLGGLAGAVISDGGILGTVGGAAIGGIIGDQVGKNR